MNSVHCAARSALFALIVGVVTGTPSFAAVSTRTSAFDYDPTTGLLTKEIIEPDSSAFCLVTAYTLDNYGNRTAATTRNCNGTTGTLPGYNSAAVAPTGDPVIAPRTTTNVMDARGQFVATVRNALYDSVTNPNQEESKTYNADFGSTATLTGPNGLTTAWYYDGFGRKTFEVRADGNGTEWRYLFCSGFYGGTATCPTINGAAAVYLVITTPVAGPINVSAGTTGPVNGPVQKTYYDALNREVRTETQGFDGSGTSTPIYKDTEYDGLGRPFKMSRPYYAGQTAYWITVAYDAMGRTVTQTQADNTVTSSSYNGLTITVTNANNQARTKVTNSQGEVVSVQDANGKTLTSQYDPFGNLTSTTDALGNQSAMVYDLRGRKTQMIDPDMGTWTYSYDALGQLIRQVDAKNQTSTMVYDLLGRMNKRTEPDLVSNWYYDFYKGGATCSKGIGKVCQSESSSGYSKTITYDSLGRISSSSTVIDVPSPYVESVTYDGNGRVSTRTYPSGLVVGYVYTALSYLQQVTNNATNAPYWQATSLDAEGHLLSQTYGNGAVTQQTFNVTNGRLTAIVAGSGNAVQNLSYRYDNLGNILQRTDGNEGLTENFGYDVLNRLTSSSVSSGGAGVVNSVYAYDDIGNVTVRPDGSTLSYPGSGAGSVRPHAVSRVTMSAGNYVTYGYDANGNQINQTTTTNNVIDHTKDRSFTFTSFNMPTSLSTSTVTETYAYGPEHQRTKLSSSVRGTTIYLNSGDRGELSYERDIHLNGSIEQRNFIGANGIVVALVKLTTASGNTTTSVLYLHRDNLNSTTAITDATGTVIERLAYEPFGKRRFPNGSTDPNNTIVGVNTDRGFTNHEMLDELTLVHMNGRIYDPTTFRFISADPHVQDPSDMQSYNRYSYVLNNPLMYTDPTGYFSLFGWLSHLFKSIMHNEVGRIAVTVAVAYFTGDFVSSAVQSSMEESAGVVYANLTAEAAISGGAAGGFAGSLVGSGGNLQQGLIGGLEGAANGFIGSAFKDYGFNVAAHAALGCTSASLHGASCGSGAMSGGFSAAAAPLASQLGRVGGPVADTVVGGTASVLGGGKFVNGAQTAAFQYLFNYCAHDGCWTTKEERAYLDRGDFLGYYSKACEGNDLNACFSYGVASGQRPGPSDTLLRGLLDQGYSFAEASKLVQSTIPLNLANDYANLLPQNEAQRAFPNAQDIAQYHWDEFAKYGLPSSTFGGTPFGKSFGLVLPSLWCPLCQKPQ